MKITTRLSKRKNDIPKAVEEFAEARATSYCNFVSYLEKFDDEILQRTFGYKKPKNKKLLITEVTRRVSGCNKYIAKNIYYSGMGGYQAVFSPKKYYIGFYSAFLEEDFDKWYEETVSRYYKVGYEIINPQLLAETKYKYCGFNNNGFLMDYLDTYNNYPNLELLSKLGIKPSKTLCQKAMKDKQFCKFLSRNKEDVIKYGSTLTLMAYKRNISISDANEEMNIKRHLKSFISNRSLKVDEEKLTKYLLSNKLSLSLYGDYIDALKYLKLSLKDTKNIFPMDFMRMHNLRINQYYSKKEKGNQKFYDAFANVAKKYAFLNLDKNYKIKIASHINELIEEGKYLHHCVGKMGYDKKMVDEKSLILFVREINKPDIPFVTMEYSLKEKRILQIYGDHDHKPSDGVLDFVNNTWLSFAKKMIKKKEKELCLV